MPIIFQILGVAKIKLYQINEEMNLEIISPILVLGFEIRYIIRYKY